MEIIYRRESISSSTSHTAPALFRLSVSLLIDEEIVKIDLIRNKKFYRLECIFILGTFCAQLR